MSIVSLMVSSMGWLVPTWECPHIVMYVDSAAAAAMSREGSIREMSFLSVCLELFVVE